MVMKQIIILAFRQTALLAFLVRTNVILHVQASRERQKKGRAKNQCQMRYSICILNVLKLIESINCKITGPITQYFYIWRILQWKRKRYFAPSAERNVYRMAAELAMGKTAREKKSAMTAVV